MHVGIRLKEKKRYQPTLSFLAETREFIAGGLLNRDRPTGKEKDISRLCWRYDQYKFADVANGQNP
jgi:hypothetical protein